MKPLNAMEQTEFTPAMLTLLEDCTEESVFAPGYIQAHGILLVLQEPHLTIMQVSENVEEFFGLAATALLGKSLHPLFSRDQVKRIKALLLQDNLESCNPFELEAQINSRLPSLVNLGNAADSQNLEALGATEASIQIFRSTIHRTKAGLLLELEPQLPTENIHSTQFYHHLQAVILNLRNTTTLAALTQMLAEEVKALTGFDRVMVYRFKADEHGVVIAEAKEQPLESYLGLHYPATDIPVPARKLFMHHSICQIPNVNYSPARLVSTNSNPEAPLDLKDCILRGVSPCHVEYLQNMGVGGSLTISLVNDNRLWGLIACHHSSPKLVSYETRKTCEFLGQFVSTELVHQQERELNRYHTQVNAIQDHLQQAFLQEPDFMQQVLTRNATQLLELVHAEGVAIVLDQQISLMGQLPSLEAVKALVAWLPQLKQHNLYRTNSLAQAYLPASAFKDTASGLLAISLVLHQKSYHLLWFRPEQIQMVHWAGDPRTAIVVDPDGEQRLTPRKSFQLWKETVYATSLPWEASEIEAALMMRNTLMLAVLEFSQAALEEAAERAAIANRAKSQFLAKMSHELRTPLNAILGFTEVMNRSPKTPTEFHQHLGIISRSGEHLLALINDVLEMSRIEAGQLVMTESDFNLHRLMKSLQEMFALKASQKGLTLSFEVDESVPRYACSDEAKLRQIMINLIDNGIKFTTQGSVSISLRAEATGLTIEGDPDDGNTQILVPVLRLLFEVQDMGCGIASRDWEAIFETFMQTQEGRQAQGTGLGLSISRQFARLMGGNIIVQSTVNVGSTFTCHVLLHQPKTVPLAEPEIAPLVIGLELGQSTYRILVVEDVLENRHLLQALLEPIGFEVHIAENGLEALTQWQQWHPHLIFMDIQMPLMNGYEATRQIREEEEKQLNEATRTAKSLLPRTPTKIIALTAYAFQDDRTTSLQAGCNDYIAKPFTASVLLEMMARHLGLRYCYDTGTTTAPDLPAGQPLSQQDLHVMSVEWIAQVHEASLDLDDGKIRQLMAQIPQASSRLLEGMAFIVDNFQLETLANLTQP
ncbi:MAG: response regulator [Cyanobacteria bacterium]|nr:response regulator [Cyanobacteriota bacterium]